MGSIFDNYSIDFPMHLIDFNRSNYSVLIELMGFANAALVA